MKDTIDYFQSPENNTLIIRRARTIKTGERIYIAIQIANEALAQSHMGATEIVDHALLRMRKELDRAAKQRYLLAAHQVLQDKLAHLPPTQNPA